MNVQNVKRDGFSNLRKVMKNYNELQGKTEKQYEDSAKAVFIAMILLGALIIGGLIAIELQ